MHYVLTNTNISTLKIKEGLEELAQTGKFLYKDGQTVKFIGVINSIKKKYTKNNKIMAFVTLEDLYGSMETVVFENVYTQSVNSLIEDNIVLVEGRLSIREDEESVSIVASKIQNVDAKGTFFNASSVPFASATNTTELRKINKLEINITNLSEEVKDKLRGALKFFAGDRNNTALFILNGEKKLPAGGIFLNGNTLDEIEEIVGKENVTIGDSP